MKFHVNLLSQKRFIVQELGHILRNKLFLKCHQCLQHLIKDVFDMTTV